MSVFQGATRPETEEKMHSKRLIIKDLNVAACAAQQFLI
jgi:hypothetical protein